MTDKYSQALKDLEKTRLDLIEAGMFDQWARIVKVVHGLCEKPEAKPDPKYLNIPNICFSLTKKHDKREPDFAKQRLTRGFDDSELWSLDHTIVNFILPRLKRFRENHCGFPFQFDCDDQWNNILDKIITALELYSKDDTNKDQDQQIEEGLDLLRKYFRTLWS